MALPLKPPIKPQLALPARSCRRARLGLRAEVRRLPHHRLRRRRGRLPAVAGGEAASPLLPRGRASRQGRYVLDGELVILDSDGREEFDALQIASTRRSPGSRCSPRRRRRCFAPSTCWRGIGASSSAKPFAERRERLETLSRASGGRKKSASGSIELTPLKPVSEGGAWLQRGGCDRQAARAPYRPGERKGMVKVKRVRTADCVVVGWRPGKEEGTVGSLILGLYDERRASRGRAHLGLPGEGEARARAEARAVRDRRAGLRRSEPLGRRTATSSGSRCAPSWWSRSASTTSATAASATAPRSCAGATTRRRRTAPSTSWSRRHSCEGPKARAVGRDRVEDVGPGLTSQVAATTSIGMAIATVTKVAARSWSHSPLRLAMVRPRAGGRRRSARGGRGGGLSAQQWHRDVLVPGDRRSDQAETPRVWVKGRSR